MSLEFARQGQLQGQPVRKLQQDVGPDGFVALSFITHRAARLRPDPAAAAQLVDRCLSAVAEGGGLRPSSSMSIAGICDLMDRIDCDLSH